MTESAAKVELLATRLEGLRTQWKELSERQEALKQEIKDANADLGAATAEHHIAQGLEVSERNLRDWFESSRGPIPEELLLRLMDSKQVDAVSNYVRSRDDEYSKEFYLRVVRETNDFVELGRSIRRGASVFQSAYKELFEERVMNTDLGEDKKLHVPEGPLKLEVLMKLARAHHYNVGEHCQDFEVLKKLVAVNTRVMHNVKSEVTGRVLKMRELVAINPKCAYFASPPITVNAGVDSRDKPEVKMKKVYDWLTITGEKKLFAKEVKIEPQQAATPPKKPFKL